MKRVPRPPVHHINPVLVEVTRGPLVESVHRGAAAVSRADGTLVAAWGDIERPVYPRSAVTPLLALPLIETGAADHFRVTEVELALACSSHPGQTTQTRLLASWLDRLGLGGQDLECGAHPPLDPAAAAELIRAGLSPVALHSSCSGKHCAMLTTALHMGETTRGYVDHTHPVQRRIAEALGDMTGCAPRHLPQAVDGCGVPTYALPLSAIALSLSRMAAPGDLGPARQGAVERILTAMSGHPGLLAGDDDLATRIMRELPGIVVKSGAEGVYAAILPQAGLGIAIKIDDGADRAAGVAMLALLRHLDILGASASRALHGEAAPAVATRSGDTVGVIRAAPEWLG